MSDTFRKSYRPLNDENGRLIMQIKSAFEEVEGYLIKVKSREMSIALTNLEQAAMWATKAIMLEDEKNGSLPI
jgi:hypothetical protein